MQKYSQEAHRFLRLSLNFDRAYMRWRHCNLLEHVQRLWPTFEMDQRLLSLWIADAPMALPAPFSPVISTLAHNIIMRPRNTDRFLQMSVFQLQSVMFRSCNS